MTQQPWLAVTLAVVMIATAAYCVGRLALSWRQGRPTDRPVDAVHALMGTAMAGLLVPQLRVVPAGGWEALFSAGAVLFVVRIVRAHRPGHDVQHVLGCGAMVYMLAAAAVAAGDGAPVVPGAGTSHGVAAGAMSGAMSGAPGIALVLAVALLGCVVWSADRISVLAPVATLAGGRPGTARRSAGTRRPLGGVPLSPRLAACCEVAMGVTMGYMLIALR